MKGFHPTPPETVDAMVAKLFAGRQISIETAVLDAGCGTGAFIEGILRWAARTGRTAPQVVGIDSDPKHLPELRRKFAKPSNVKIEGRDFLVPDARRFDFIISNPPYIPITGLSEAEKEGYRRCFATAKGRFDLYLLFFEQAISVLKPGGRLVFITPEKFLYVDTAAELRRILARLTVEEIHLVDEGTFGGLVTYPTITTVTNAPPARAVKVVLRDGARRDIRLPADGSSWQSTIRGAKETPVGPTLGDIATRISCGVATGADSVFVVPTTAVPKKLRRLARPTISGRQVRPEKPEIRSTHSMLIPYGGPGELLPEDEIPELVSFLRENQRYSRLVRRTCASRKPWYAFHETPPLDEMLRPKILCKDIGERPVFLADVGGKIVPRHSMYYIVPKNSAMMGRILRYLNSPVARQWLEMHCQRAANGFIRLQSNVLKQLPVPLSLLNGQRKAWEAKQPASPGSAALTVAVSEAA